MNEMLTPKDSTGAIVPSSGSPPLDATSCQTCGQPRRGEPRSAGGRFVYAIGRIESRFPSPGVEKELAQAIGRAQTVKLTDRQALHQVLSAPENRYLVRQL